MKHLLIALIMLAGMASSAQTLPDSIQKQLTELRQQQADLKEIVRCGGRNIETGASVLAPGIILMGVGTVLGVLPTAKGERSIDGIPAKKFAGVICVTTGGVFSIAGAMAMFHGGRKLHQQRMQDL